MVEATETHRLGQEEASTHGDFTVVFPKVDSESEVPQDAEYCLVRVDGRQRRVRFHDYDEIYTVPGLYEHIFYEKLECQSPALIGKLLQHEIERRDELDMKDLKVLDVGAGNGIMAETLKAMGAGHFVGVDILNEAEEAANRDRPGLYDSYYAVNLLELPRSAHQALQQQRFNCMTLIAALGFGDIPPEAFTVAYNLVENGGLVAFNLRDMFLDGDDASGFSKLIGRMLDAGWLEEAIRVRYVHRLSITGEPLFYNAIIGRKLANIPTESGPKGSEN